MESGLTVRALEAADRQVWVGLYGALFPQSSYRACLAEIDRVLADPVSFAFVAERDGAAIGFAEMCLRPYANGCASKPVAFLEGIYVIPKARGRGVAARLLAHVEDFARSQGHRELGSDVLQGNADGLAFHGAAGFEETERVIYFRKSL